MTFSDTAKSILEANGLDHEPYEGLKHCTYCLMYNDLLAAHQAAVWEAVTKELEHLSHYTGPRLREMLDIVLSELQASQSEKGEE